MSRNIKKIVVVKNKKSICFCTIGKKTKHVSLQVEGKIVHARLCQYCKTAYVKQDEYIPELLSKYTVLADVRDNEKQQNSMMKRANDLRKEQKRIQKENTIEYLRKAKIAREKEIAIAIEKEKELAEHKKRHEGKIEIYSHDMENHYTRPFVPKSPKEKKKRSFFS